jgi:hypothetical protein
LLKVDGYHPRLEDRLSIALYTDDFNSVLPRLVVVRIAPSRTDFSDIPRNLEFVEVYDVRVGCGEVDLLEIASV